jgi:hypothetical protein
MGLHQPLCRDLLLPQFPLSKIETDRKILKWVVLVILIFLLLRIFWHLIVFKRERSCALEETHKYLLFLFHIAHMYECEVVMCIS